MKEKKRNIGLLVSELENEFTYYICEGAAGAAKELNVNLFIFPGKYINPDYEDKRRNKYEYQNNILFSYAATQDLDMLLIDMGTIATNLSDQEKLDFLKQFNVPVIAVASKVPGYSSIRFNNITGFHNAITHVVREHGRKKIGFVSGPETSADALERLGVYRTVLEENQISYDEKRVVYGNFSEYSDKIVADLLDCNPDLDAVVFANDMMALGAYRVFEERGIKVGQDISVVGFDDALCATNMTPNLTTVKADAAQLGYYAVMASRDITAGVEKDILVDSVFIPRESCGCKGNAFRRLHLKPDDLCCEEQLHVMFDELCQFLFGRNRQKLGLMNIKDTIYDYLVFFRDNIAKEADKEEKDWEGLIAHMKKISSMELAPYTDIIKIFFLFDCMYDMVKEIIHNPQVIVRLSETYSKYYREVAKRENQLAGAGKTALDWFNRIATNFNRDVLNFPIGDDGVYYTVADKISQLHYKSFYLCLFDKPVPFFAGDRIQTEKEILIKAFVKNQKPGCPPVGEQRRQVQGLLPELYREQKKDAVVIVTLLYSAQEQYGLMIHEIPNYYMNYITPITAQISSAIGMLELLKNKDIIATQLEESLAQIKEANLILDEMSKSDELTQIYNRRGFLTMVQNQIIYEKNEMKRAVVIFADMNNLKIVNDQFGHEEGDYSLRLIATILKEALPNGIVGRFGGDEFAGFGLLGEADKAVEIRNRIKEITRQHNDNNDKPYYVSMSVGLCEFVCGKDVVLKDLMDQADVDLYLEKKHKRNNILKN